MKKSIECLQSNLCCECSKPFAQGTMRLGGALLAPCSVTPGRVHVAGLEFHEDCTYSWHETFNKGVQHQLCDYVPLLPRDDVHTNNAFLKWREDCLSKHKLIMAFCAGCGLQAQEHCRFRACSGCRNVRYCTTECQTAHWPTHKPLCKAPSKGPVERSVIDESLRCACFTAYETSLFERMFTNLCSRAECTNVVEGPIPASMYVGECALRKPGSLPGHVIATKYCSQKCQIAVTSHKK